MSRPLIALLLLLSACQTTHEAAPVADEDRAQVLATQYGECLRREAAANRANVANVVELEYVITGLCGAIGEEMASYQYADPWLDPALKAQIPAMLRQIAQSAAVQAFY